VSDSLVTLVLIVAIQNFWLKELLQCLFKRITKQNIKTNIHYVVNLIGLVATRKTLNLTLQRTPKDLLHHRSRTTSSSSSLVGPLAVGAALLQLLEAEAGVVAGVNHVAQELVRVLLAATPEVLGENPETALDPRGRVQCEIHPQRPRYPLLQYAEGAVAPQIACTKTGSESITRKEKRRKKKKKKGLKCWGAKRKGLEGYVRTEGGVLAFEAEIGERRSVCEALEDTVEVTRVAEVLQPQRRTALPLMTQ